MPSSETASKKGSDQKEFYIDQKELRKLIREYKEQLKIDPDGTQMGDELGKMLISIANKFTSRSCFSGYSYRQDFIMAALEKMIKAVEKIDPDDPRSPFSYLTQTCFRSVILFIKKEKKHEEGKECIKDHIYSKFSAEYNLQSRSNNDATDATNDQIQAEDDVKIDDYDAQ